MMNGSFFVLIPENQWQYVRDVIFEPVWKF